MNITMKKNFILISLALLFIHISGAKGQQLAETQVESIKREVDSIFLEMVISAEKLDFGKLSSGVNDNNLAGFIVNGKYYTRFSTVIDDMKTNTQGIRGQNISIITKKITVLSENNVLLTASGTSEASLSDGRLITSEFHWSFIYQKIDNSWKVIYSHQSLAR